jgi:hypothetical protein
MCQLGASANFDKRRKMHLALQLHGQFKFLKKTGNLNTCTAGTLLFTQGGHGKSTPKKARRAAQNPAKPPFFALKNTFFALKPRFGG